MANNVLLTAIGKILDYLSDVGCKQVCTIINTYDPSSLSNPRSTCDQWTPDYSRQQSLMVVTSIQTQEQALRLLSIIAKYGVSPDNSYPQIQNCRRDLLKLDTLEYGYLWDGVGSTPFCQAVIPGDGTVNYSPINYVTELLANPSTEKAVSVIISSFRGALSVLDPTLMKTTCSTAMTYADLNGVLEDLCGCYINIDHVEQFTTDEKSFLSQNPQCLPSCFNAAVRYVSGGIPVPCQQDICIADDINVTGTSASIKQVCPQCSQLRECVCYIHMNGKLINNQTCNTVYTVDPKGNITETTYNKAPAPGSGIKLSWSAIIHSKFALISILVVVALLIIAIMSLLIIQHMRSRRIK